LKTFVNKFLIFELDVKDFFYSEDRAGITNTKLGNFVIGRPSFVYHTLQSLLFLVLFFLYIIYLPFYNFYRLYDFLFKKKEHFK